MGQSATKRTLWDQGVPSSYCEEKTSLLGFNVSPCATECQKAPKEAHTKSQNKSDHKKEI